MQTDKEIIFHLKKDLGITQAEIAKELNVSTAFISQIALGAKKLPYETRKYLEEKYKISLSEASENTSSKITFYDVKGACGHGTSIVGFEPEVNFLMIDNNVINKILRTKPENLFIIKACGDSMEDVGIYEDDILLVDKSKTNPLINGIYVFTTHQNELIFIKRLNLRPDNKLEVISENKSYEKIVYTNAELEKLEFSIKGRVLKNLSRGL